MLSEIPQIFDLHIININQLILTQRKVVLHQYETPYKVLKNDSEQHFFPTEPTNLRGLREHFTAVWCNTSAQGCFSPLESAGITLFV